MAHRITIEQPSSREFPSHEYVVDRVEIGKGSRLLMHYRDAGVTTGMDIPQQYGTSPHPHLTFVGQNDTG